MQLDCQQGQTDAASKEVVNLVLTAPAPSSSEIRRFPRIQFNVIPGPTHLELNLFRLCILATTYVPPIPLQASTNGRVTRLWPSHAAVLG